MTKSKEVLYQALQALEYYRKNEDHEPTPASLTIGWLRQALAEPEIKRSQELFGKTEELEAENKRLQEREWVGLTDEELYCNDARSQEDLDYGRLVEAKLKEKNCG